MTSQVAGRAQARARSAPSGVSALLVASAAALLASCGRASSEIAATPPRGEPGRAAGSAELPAAADETACGEGTPCAQERLAAIQKAMNELDEAAQQCWAAAATERFDIEGELAFQVDIAPTAAHASVVRDTARNAALSACVVGLLSAYRWAPPLHGQTIQLPFRFRAPDSQNTIDRTLVSWRGQGKVSLAVLLDENNTGNDAASMFELAIAPGGATGLRRADRAELWYFLSAGTVRGPGGQGVTSVTSATSATSATTTRAVAAGDMMYVAPGAARDAVAGEGELRAVVVVVPGGREGAARSGALPTREVAAGARLTAPVMLPAAGAHTHGPATIFAEPSTIGSGALAASILTLPAGAKVAEHVHAGETEALYVLAGGGQMTVNGVALPVVPTSVVQIPKQTKHAFTATSDLRALQIYSPAGPEQRFKAKP